MKCRLQVAIPPYQDRSLSKESRVAYWTKHQLNTVSDLRAYPKHTFPPLRNNEAAEQRIKPREETMSSGDASQSGDESDADMSAINRESFLLSFLAPLVLMHSCNST